MFNISLPIATKDRSKIPQWGRNCPYLIKSFGQELTPVGLWESSCCIKVLQCSRFWKSQDIFEKGQGRWEVDVDNGYDALCGFNSPPPLLQSPSGPRRSSVASAVSSSAPWTEPLRQELRACSYSPLTAAVQRLGLGHVMTFSLISIITIFDKTRRLKHSCYLGADDQILCCCQVELF